MSGKYYVASFCRNGMIGGGITVGDDGICYRTNKLTVPAAYRDLRLPYEDIEDVIPGSVLGLPAVTVRMKNKEEYKFQIFAKNSFMEEVKGKIK